MICFSICLLRYSNFTQNTLTCSLANTVVGPLNATLLIDSQYGRSLTAPNLFYVTPNEQIYNYEAYAREHFFIINRQNIGYILKSV